MALDLFSALSVAAAVVQFIDFARTVVCKSTEIYQATNGMLPEDEDTETATERLQKRAQDLEIAIRINPQGHAELDPIPVEMRPALLSRQTRLNEALRRICNECSAISRELLQKLAQLKLPSRAHFRRWKSFRQALKNVWAKRDINVMAGRLAQLRSDLDTHVLILVRESQTIFSIADDVRFQALNDRTKAMVEKLAEIQTIHRTEMSHTQTQWRDLEAERRRILGDQLTKFQDEVRRSQDACLARSEELLDSFEEFKEKYTAMTSGAVARHIGHVAGCIQENILRSLRFLEIDHRHDGIPKAHRNTCQWAFQDPQQHQLPWDSFSAWLSQGSGLYWVEGKAGCGKSTLMKYIWNHKTTVECLDFWAKHAACVSGIYFFWNGGTLIQRTQEGLIQSLLYSVLRHERSLVSDVFPEEWPRKSTQFAHQCAMTAEVWSLGRLQSALERLIALASDELKVCFFLDGLDEFAGHPGDLARYIHKLSHMSEHANFCVSSRPWPVFHDIVKGMPRLRVQDLNRRDIALYVGKELGANADLQQLRKTNLEDCNELMREIVDRSLGVFLWVFLVVRSLMAGLQNGDEVMHLRNRLIQLPTELETLFDALLSRVDAADKPESSMIFQIFRASGQHLDIYTLFRALRWHNINDVLNMRIERGTRSHVDGRLERLKPQMDRFWMRVNSRTMGLLEAPSPAWREVYVEKWETRDPLFVPARREHQSLQRICYLHRTVKDFVEQDAVWCQIVKQVPDPSFNPNTALLMALVVEAKTIGRSIEPQHLCDTGLQLFQKAARLRMTPSVSDIRLVDHLDSVLTDCSAGTTVARHDSPAHWSALDPWGDIKNGNVWEIARITGLDWYLEARWGQPLQNVPPRSL